MASKDPEKEKMGALLDETMATGKAERVEDSASEDHHDIEKVPTLPAAAEKKRKVQLNPLRWRKPPPVPEKRTVSGEFTANWFSRLTFHWIGDLMDTGYLRTLEFEDIPLVNPNRSSTLLADKVTKAFDKYREKGAKHPLLRALHEVFKWEFWSGGLYRLLADILLTVSPFLMKYLIAFSAKAYYAAQNDTESPPIGQGIGYVLGITAFQVIASFAFNQFVYRGMSTGGVVRASLISLLFSKSMRISARAKAGGLIEEAQNGENPEEDKKKKKKEEKKKVAKGKMDAFAEIAGYPNGKVVNLMGTDTYRIDQAMAWIHMVWTAPVIVIIALIMLCINLGASALAGFALLIAGAPLLTLVVKSLATRRTAMNKITDKRVSLMQEILLGVKFVKYYAWEKSFMKELGSIRSQEVHAVQVMLAIRSAVNAVGISLPIFASMLAFIVYSTTGNVVDPAPIFSSLALFNMLRLPLNLLPIVVAQTIDAFVSLKRIEDYLTAEEVGDFVSYDIPPESDDAIVIKDGEFTWETTQGDNDKKDDKKDDKKKDKKGKKSTGSKDEAEAEKETSAQKEPFRIKDINLTFGKKELVAIVGTVGSGKTSLLAAIAQDMRKVKGDIHIREGHQIAYCPQYAWIQNATVRDNIVFGKPFDKRWYDEVTDACALGPDFEILPYGDFTEIGERGITISGGQKARTNIARAIYFNAEIVLMDDPLSAVDAHVGRHLFENAIAGLLKDKCVILATHQLHVLNRVDRIVWMENGRVRDVGTHDELLARSPDFAKMMEQTTVGADEEEEDEKEKDELELVKKESVALSSKSNTNRAKSKALMQEEERATKSVPWSIYAAYVKASGSIWVGPAVFLLLCCAQASNIMTTLWLGYWTAGKYNLTREEYIGGYAALGAAQSFFFFIFAYCLMVMGTRASKKLMSNAMERVLRAPMSFFDTTPMGRIVNRFSKDVDVLDNNITDAMRMYFMTLSMISSVIVLIIVYFPYFAVALVPLVAFFFFAAAYYRASAREVKRHEAVLRSNVFAKFGEGLSGTACIRAFGLQERFITELQDAIDQMDSAYFVTFVNQRWLSLRLDFIGNSMVFVTGILVVTSRLSINPSISGVVLSYVLQIVGMIQWMIRQLAEVENAMNAAERLYHYGEKLESEAALTSANPPPPSWPEHGEIHLEKVSMRYRPGLPLVLKELTLHIEAGQRVAIVGRTGAGKSTIMSVLFRLVEVASGKVTIDGVDISKIGLHELRRNLAIIPQDPTLFKGTIRSNLDPFNEYLDDVLNEALGRCNLLTSTPASPASSTDQVASLNLSSTVEEGGTNFSLGQRQLLALARALVRNCRIILADEATSSVDLETDAKIQETMRTAFKGKTILTIAHRLGTIVGYDKVVVLGNGGILEYGTPKDLWDEKGVFWEMCERGGVSEDDF